MATENISREFRVDDWVSLTNNNYENRGYKTELVGIIVHVYENEQGNKQYIAVFDDVEDVVDTHLIISDKSDIDLVWPSEEPIPQTRFNQRLTDTANINEGPAGARKSEKKTAERSVKKMTGFFRRVFGNR